MTIPNQSPQYTAPSVLEPFLTDEPTSTPAPSVCLTEEQHQAIEAIIRWLGEPSREFKLGGYAGTGKTTLIKALQERLSECYINVVAFTGKAVSVLQRKGVYAQTIHSLIYKVTTDPVTKALFFYKKGCLAPNPDLIIIDEASMVSRELYSDLASFGIKLLFVGDPGQLEPVGDNPNLMRSPDVVLSKIHRQAENSPILTLADRVRNGGHVRHPFAPSHANFNDLEIRGKKISVGDSLQANQILCARNKTRIAMNETIRRCLERTEVLSKGEKLIVLRNNRNFGVYNGLIVNVVEILNDKPDYWLVEAKDEVENVLSFPLWKGPFIHPAIREAKEIQVPYTSAKDFGERMRLVFADYAYAITCHKSQGSEWDHVLVFDEWMPPQVWDMKRWRYTAITRAAKKLTYLI